MIPTRPQDPMADGQIAKATYLRHMTAMKSILNQEERRLNGRDSAAFKFYKKFIMDEFYMAMSDVFEAMEKSGLLQKCPCGTGIRQGYKQCSKCSGAGWCNSESFAEHIRMTGPDNDILNVAN